MSFEASRLKQLVETARNGSSEARCALLRDIADAFLAQPDSYNPAELQHFDVILSRLTENAALALRREIAERFADAPAAPKGLIAQLAHDDISVAEPVLRRSKALGEQELIAITLQSSQAHLKAIARRRDATPGITQALSMRGEEEVLTSLAKNQSAQFTPDAMRMMVTKARKMTALQDPMARRYDLPPQLLTRIYFYVPQSLKKEILNRSDMLDPELVEVAITANRHKILDEAMEESHDEHAAARKFIVEKIKENAVNEKLLQSLITQKRQAEFLLAFAHLTGIDLASVRAVISDTSFEALAIACRAADVERQTFTKIVFALCKAANDKTKALRILDLYTKVPVEAAERIMRFWRMRTDAAAEAGHSALFAGDEPLTLTKRAEG